MEQAMGSSQLPGTDWTTMLDSFTPAARSLDLVPARRASIMAEKEGGIRIYFLKLVVKWGE